MNDSIHEWVDKAEGDFLVASRENRARRNPCYDAVCFHAQQCVEKYLKAVLAQEGLPIRKIHDLAILLQDCLPVHPLWEAMRPDLERLSENAVLIRYPGESATPERARRAIAMMRACRNEIRPTLGLPSDKAVRTRKKG